MRFIDLDSGELRAFITAGAIESETSKRGSAPKYAVQFVRAGAVLEIPAQTSGALIIGRKYVITTFVAGDNFTNVGGTNVTGNTFTATGTTPTTWTHASALNVADEVIIGFKATSGYDSVAYVVGPFTALKSGSGITAVYTFSLSFLTALLDQLFATNLDSVELEPEIKWVSLTENGETLDFDWIVQNNVNRGGETVSAYPVTAVTTALPAVTRLTGGVLGTDLDAQLLAGFPNKTVFEVVTDLTGGGILGESRWQKRVGAEVATDVPAGVILCLDGTRVYRVDG